MQFNKLSVGVLKETKDHENRVGLNPLAVIELAVRGHAVYVESNAGLGAGYDNEKYIEAGAQILNNPEAVVRTADIIVKVKEPTPSEFYLLKDMAGKTLFTFLHLADNPDLANELLKHNITGISYDTIEDKKGRLPILKPMSEIAGRFAIDFFAEKIHDGKIKNVLIVGGGVTGTAAAERAIELDVADVVIHEKNLARATQLEKKFENDQVDVFLCSKKLPKEVSRADLVVGAVLVKGQKAPKVITEDMINGMRRGANVVDISIDQGGCVFGSRPTTHSNPTFEFMGKTYCCIPNMPGMRPHEATNALVDSTISYLIEMVKRGPFQYLVQEPWLLKGINTHAGKICNKVIASDLDMMDKFVDLTKQS